MADLTYKQRLFVHYYLGVSNGNAADATRRAGYKDYQVTPTRLLAKASIRAAINGKLTTVGMSQDEILARLAEQAASSFDDFMHINGGGSATIDLKKAKKLGKLHLIRKLKQTEHGLEIDLKDSFAALVKLGDFLKLWSGDNVVGVDMEALAARLKQRITDAKKQKKKDEK